MDMDRLPYFKIHIRQIYLTQRILNMITGVVKASADTTPAVKPPLGEKEGSQARKNDYNYISVIGSLDLLTNPTRPKAQFVVFQCALFSSNTKIPHDQEVKRVLKYPKISSAQGIIMKPDPEKGIKFYVDTGFLCGWNQ